MFGFGGARKPADNSKYYELLGVEKDASASDIKKAFRKAAVQHHPDKGGDAEKFKELNKAYEVLSDQEKRHMYDEFGEEAVENGGAGGAGMGSDIFDLFGGLGGGRRGGPRGAQKRKGENVEFATKVTLEQLYNGHRKPLRLTRKIICPDCEGKGGKADAVKTCNGCNGNGVKVQIRQLGPGMIQQMQSQCNQCNGEGKVIPPSAVCKKCKGTKTVKNKETLELYINPGMKSDERIVFREKADEAPNTIPGDVIVVLEVEEHSVFKRMGSDLHLEKHITLLEALTGFTFHLNQLDGRVLKVPSEKGKVYHPDEVKVIEGEGMPMHKNPHVKGNLYVQFKIDFPKESDLTPEVRSSLLKLLPGPSAERLDLSEADVEVVHMEAVNEEAEKAKKQREEAHRREQYDEDEPSHQEGPGCRAQ